MKELDNMKELDKWQYYETFGDLKKNHFDFSMNSGYVYLIKIGKNIKIGKTKKPINRISVINGIAINYIGEELSGILLSKNHLNYSKNEKRLHSKFKEKRIRNGELFNITFSEAFNFLEHLKFKENKNPISADDKREYRNKTINNYEESRNIKFYEDCVNVTHNAIETKYKSLLESLIGCDLNHNFEEILGDLNFIKVTLYADRIASLISQGYNFRYIENEMKDNKNDIDYIANCLLK